MFPEADIFTAVYDPEGTEGRFEHRNVHTSFLQKLHPNATSFRRLLPLYPYAMEALDLSGYDLVLSSSQRLGARRPAVRGRGPRLLLPQPVPLRLERARGDAARAARRSSAAGAAASCCSAGASGTGSPRSASTATSRTPRRRAGAIARYFTREAEVVYPPVEIERFAPGVVGEHYAVLSELMPHKRIDLAVRAFNELGRPLVVIGDGPDARRLQRLAGPQRPLHRPRQRRRGRAPARRRSRALVVTATEEFGIAAVEAQAAGRPVVALDEGGVTESVLEGRDRRVLRRGDARRRWPRRSRAFDPLSVDPADCVANAQRFSRRRVRAGDPRERRRGAGRGPEPARRPPPPGARARARRPPRRVTRR